MLTKTYKGKEVKAIEAFIDTKTRHHTKDKKIVRTNQYRVLFTDGSYLMIQACGCCDGPWLDDNVDLGTFDSYHKWVEA